jgi:sarcosine oxidase subunit alpha
MKIGVWAGDCLLAESHTLNDAPATEWIAQVEPELLALPNVRIMSRTAVFGAFDHGVYGPVERVGDHVDVPSNGLRQTLWQITAKRTVLAAGATERHIPFANNDRPGVMSAGALRAYANRYAVSPANSVAIFTNGDDGHRTALDLAARGLTISAVIDTRADAKTFGDYPLFAGGVVSDTKGELGLKRIAVTQNGQTSWIEAGALGVAGGWNPNVHLSSHHRWSSSLERRSASLLAKHGCGSRYGGRWRCQWARFDTCGFELWRTSCDRSFRGLGPHGVIA